MTSLLVDAARLVVLTSLIAGAVLALGSWAVTSRRISPFSRTARLIRRLTDPAMAPLERFLVRRGGNPRNAPWWLLGIVIVGGIAFLTAAQWLAGAIARSSGALRSGPRGTIRMVIYYAGQLLALALLVRVIASWVGAGRHLRWMRPFYLLTDWIVEPLRRVIPPIGMFDISPLVAWLVVQLVVGLLLKVV
jgi:YggT family protein